MNDRDKTAERLKAARSLAGYGNRKDFCAHFDIPYDTLDAWERGKNPLTLKGAKRIVNILKSKDIYCSEEWLMTGDGLSPRPLKETIIDGTFNVEINQAFAVDPSESLPLLEKNLNLATEISTFTTLNKDSIITIIQDETLLPFYEKGDYVGGIRFRGDDLSKALNRKCIVEFRDGRITVGCLQSHPRERSKKSPLYKVCVLNKKHTLKKVSFNKGLRDEGNTKHMIEKPSTEIVSAAPILWHRTFPTW